MFDFGNRGDSSPIGFALLIQAIFWVGIALAVQSALSISYVTLSMVFIGFSELGFKYLCIRLAINQGVSICRVHQVFTDEYLRHVDSYTRLLLYVAVQAIVFLVGIGATLLSTFPNGDALVLIGAANSTLNPNT